jgi:excisionase family DNA binding protein
MSAVAEGQLAYTIRQAAALLAVCPRTIQNMIANGTLRAVRVGGRGDSPRGVRIPRDALLEFARGGPKDAPRKRPAGK